MSIAKVWKSAVVALGLMCMMSMNVLAQEITQPTPVRFKELQGVTIGNAQNESAKKGVTVLVFKDGAKTGVHISGGGSASRETPVLDPTKEDIGIHAIVLAGGSAFGLAASDGVMQCLEEHGIGFDTRFARVPLVVQSDIFDLAYGSSKIRPDSKMGYEACMAALRNNNPVSGNIGAGTGATVGKLMGMRQAMKAGIGYHAVQIGQLKLGAVVVVNALGDVYSSDTGKKIAGLRNASRTEYLDSVQELYRIKAPQNLFTRTNTTIGAIVTNGKFDKAQLTRIAEQATNAYARCIRPVGTLADGDTIYAASCGELIDADVNMVGTLAADVMAKAIEDAIVAAQIPEEEYLANCLTLP